MHRQQSADNVTLMQVFLKSSSTYSQTRGAAMRSGSDPPMSRYTVLQHHQCDNIHI